MARTTSTTPLLPPPAPRPPLLPPTSALYPLLGLPYLFTHPQLHPSLLSRLLPLSLLSLLVLSTLFTLLYIPHVLLLTLFHSPLAWSNAALMVLSESASVIALLAEALFTERQLVDVFDTVLLAELGVRAEGMVRATRAVEYDDDGQWRLGAHSVDPYLKWRASARITLYFLLELPLNLVPLVGTPLFLLLQAYHLGPLSHYRYFQLLRLQPRDRKEMVERNRWRYAAFGAVHVLLQIVPVLSVLFLFSTAVGAALWAVENEKRTWEGVEAVEDRVGEVGTDWR
ncbi:hypothetical protein EDC01DRAFT_723114 [Geopyxis carbonaria]|nr:hypothetical protein EDC01DRAFT_723114 [Geopyxis carbonaria]